MHPSRSIGAAVVALLLLNGCAADEQQHSGFPTGAAVDYQLGGAFPPAPGVGIVARDSTAEPAEGVYSICYVNGFQTQPGEAARWTGENSDLLLRDADGEPVMDPGWPDEALLDTSSTDRRERIASEIGSDLARCSDRGFDAVEIDNLDSFTRSDGRLDVGGAAELARLFADRAHALGLLIGQKNTPDHAERMRSEAGFDFAVAEQCVQYDECESYTDVYGDAVIDIEYTTPEALAADRSVICAVVDRPPSLVIRDRELAPAGDPGHVYAVC